MNATDRSARPRGLRPAAAAPARRGLLLLGLSWLATTAPAGAEPLDLAPLRDRLVTILEASAIQGAAIRVVTPERALALDWGVADAGRSVAVDADTRFRAGSFSKLITSLLVLRAEAAGRLTLADPVARHVPGALTDERITLEQLLEHTAGLRGSNFVEHGFDREGATPAEYVDRFGPWEPRWPPGLHFSYANGGHTIAARAVETAWAGEFDALVAREVFEPLGMADSDFAPGSDEGDRTTVSFGPRGETVQPRWRMPFRPSGALVATADDLVRVVSMLIRRGETDAAARFLSREAIERLETARTGLAARAGAGRGAYGLGSFTFVAGGVPFHGHWGRTEGFQTSVGYHRASGIGFVLLVNTGDRRGMNDLRDAIGALLAGPIEQRTGLGVPPASAAAAPIADDFDLSGVFVTATEGHPHYGWIASLIDAVTIERSDGLERLAVAAPWPAGGPATSWERVGPALFRAAELPLATATLAEVDGERFWVNGGSYRATPAWRFHATRGLLATGFAAGPIALLAVGFGALRSWRRGGPSPEGLAARRAWLGVTCSSGCLWLLFVLLVGISLLDRFADSASLGRVGLTSGSLTLLSLAIPILALVSLREGRAARRPGVAGVLALMLLAVSALLAAHGWLPLRTWAGG